MLYYCNMKAGRKKLNDKAVPVTAYVKQSVIKKNGGIAK